MKSLNYILLGSLLALLCACASNEESKAKCEAQNIVAPKAISVSVDCSKQIGKIKPLNGVNFGPKISTESAGMNFRKEFYDLNVSSVRTHDVSLQNPGLMICDTDMIFPLFHADANDPRNYIFKPTDDYLKVASAEGAKILFRLGVSIDHSKGGAYRTWMPEAKKWADVCTKIIAHYNEGWANGHKMGIQYWEIWNEPECKNHDGSHTMWAGDIEQFTKFYIEVSKILKARYPHLKIGGPAFTWASPMAKKFINDVAKAGAPLDFFSWHYYGKDLKDLTNQTFKVRKWLDDAGFKHTETDINEWHYFPVKWSELRGQGTDKEKIYDRIKGIEAGVFATSIMTLWQDAPMDRSHYYTAGSGGNWGMLNYSGVPYKSYYPFKAFGEIVKYENRLMATTPDKWSVPVLAGKNDKGKVAVLVSLFNAGKSVLSVDLKNCKSDISKAKVLICDDSKNLELAEGVKIKDSVIEVPVNSDYACVLISL